MTEDIHIPDLPGYVSVKEAASLLGISDKRVYQYVMAGRLPAKRVGHILILPVEEVRLFKPGPSGRTRTRAPSWRTYRSRGALFATEIRVQVSPGQQEKLIEKLKTFQKTDNHTFPGTVARYVMKGDEEFSEIHILLLWKDTEMPDEETRLHDLTVLKDELAGVLDWSTAQESTNEVLLHT